MSVLQGWGWENLLYEDLNQARDALEAIQGLKMQEDQMFGVSLLPPGGEGDGRGPKDVLVRSKRLAPIVLLLICWGTVVRTASGAIAGGVVSAKYDTDIKLMEKSLWKRNSGAEESP